MIDGSLELAVTVRESASLAAPDVMPLKLTVCWAASSLRLRLAMGFKVGASFTGLIVTVKTRTVTLLLGCPSFTRAVIVTVPNALATGLKVRVAVGLPLV